MLRRAYLDLTDKDAAFENSLRSLGEDGTICSPEGKKSEFCGGQPRPGRGKFCCNGLKCGGEKGKYCVDDGKEKDGGGDDTICGKEGEKAVECNANPRNGRGEKCCGDLVCGGEKKKYCVVKPDDEAEDDDKDEEQEDEDEEQEEEQEEEKKPDSEGEDDDDEDEDDEGQEDEDEEQVEQEDEKPDSEGEDDEDEEEDDGKREGYEAPPIDRSGDKSLGFLWHLYYEPGIKWAHRGYSFCVMCRNYKCEKNDYVVTSHCNANLDHFRWEWVDVGDGAGLMKTKTEDLCLEGMPKKKWNFILRPCDKANGRQHFLGLDESGEKFQLLPKEHQRKTNSMCITMLHHPLAANDDDGEMIIDQVCYKAERTETSYWTADYSPKIKEELKKAKKVCRNKDCDECEGYCEKDSECKGDLVCYERGGKGWRTNLENKYDPNPWAQIPGCSGYGKHGKNYCAKKAYKSPYSDAEIKKILDKS